MEFKSFNKIARLNRKIIVTEKLDGTNAQIMIDDVTILDPDYVLAESNGLGIVAGSRNRYLTREKDNFGFAAWVQDNAFDLMSLGAGTHYGEWWGQGIQRGYGLDEKRFSLFNVHRWGAEEERPECCGVVPVLYVGYFSQGAIDEAVEELRLSGSAAVPGYMNPEGVVVFHTANQSLFKVTCEDDDKPKTCIENNAKDNK